MPRIHEVRDPIHRTILLDDEERLVVDHPWFQRLRAIRQLGFVSLVYPGAVHDRFQHSLGVCHLAGAAFDHLVTQHRNALADFTDGDLAYGRRVLRLAGLLHDVGHAPFSHTAEAHLCGVEAFALPDSWYRAGHQPQARRASHEDCTLALVHGLAAEGVLEEELARDVAAVLSETVRRSPRLATLGSLVALLRSLVSGELDADREDYLLRDSHYAGVTYGIFDLQRLLACLVVVPGRSGPQLGLDVHGVHVFEGLLLARYHMFLQVYFHKTPPAFEYFLSQALSEGEIELSFSGGLEDLVHLRDDVLTTRLHAAAAAGGAWSRRIVAREPAKLVLRERVGEGRPENALSLRLFSELQAAGCRVFARRSTQRFTALAGAGGTTDGVHLPCVRRVLGRSVVETVTDHSHLLAAFNRPIDLQHTYVLREDEERASAVMRRLELAQ